MMTTDFIIAAGMVAACILMTVIILYTAVEQMNKAMQDCPTCSMGAPPQFIPAITNWLPIITIGVLGFLTILYLPTFQAAPKKRKKNAK